MTTNTLALGAAYQRGACRCRGEALEQAIELNGAAVEKNLAAFALGPRGGRRAGRRRGRHARRPRRVEPARELSDARASSSSALAVNGDRGELRRLVEVRVPELVAYQNAD